MRAFFKIILLLLLFIFLYSIFIIVFSQQELLRRNKTLEMKNQRLEEIQAEISAYRDELEKIQSETIPSGERIPVRQIEEKLDGLLQEAYDLNQNGSIGMRAENRLPAAVSAAGVILLGAGAAGLYKSKKRSSKHNKTMRKK